MMTVFIFYVWLVPRDKIDSSVRDAMLLPMMTSASSFTVDTLLTMGLMSPDLADDLQTKIGNPSTLSARGDAEVPPSGGGGYGFGYGLPLEPDGYIEPDH
jgi:hypothetical protein